MPSITKIQELIENTWSNGFDLQDKTQLGGCLKGAAKWIGASDVCTMLSALRLRYEVVAWRLSLKCSLLIKKLIYSKEPSLSTWTRRMEVKRRIRPQFTILFKFVNANLMRPKYNKKTLLVLTQRLLLLHIRNSDDTFIQYIFSIMVIVVR